ncbi:GNAT family N-acetyltransferase [Candidatus Pacearchaeota archaeon]|nr:GNAT family N-acetyltransferase [Candidatus Pacearchaeota archaeon]
MKNQCRFLMAPEDYQLVIPASEIFLDRLNDTSNHYPAERVRKYFEHYTPEFFRELIEGSNNYGLLAHFDDRSIDGILIGSNDCSSSNQAHINWIMVASSGRGIGSKLINCFLDDAQEKGARSAILNVSKKNEKAIRLYEKLGFKVNSKYSKGKMLNMKRCLALD